MSLDEKFKAACEQVRKFTKRPPDSDILELYSLYKQATVGNINTPKPTTKEKEPLSKWEAWSSRKGMSSTSAKEHYVNKCKDLSKKYA